MALAGWLFSALTSIILPPSTKVCCDRSRQPHRWIRIVGKVFLFTHIEVQCGGLPRAGEFHFEKWKCSPLSHVRLFATPRTVVACQAPSSMEFSRQEYWRGLPFPSPGDLSDPGIKPGSPTLQADSLPSEPPGKPDFLKWKTLYLWVKCLVPELFLDTNRGAAVPLILANWSGGEATVGLRFLFGWSWVGVISGMSGEVGSGF